MNKPNFRIKALSDVDIRPVEFKSVRSPITAKVDGAVFLGDAFFNVRANSPRKSISRFGRYEKSSPAVRLYTSASCLLMAITPMEDPLKMSRVTRITE